MHILRALTAKYHSVNLVLAFTYGLVMYTLGILYLCMYLIYTWRIRKWGKPECFSCWGGPEEIHQTYHPIPCSKI